MPAVGDRVPEFTLPDTSGEEHSLRVPAVLVFTCNHCPYALAWHDRIAAAARDYPDFAFYAINPTDAERYPHDSLEAMRERVESEGDWPMPYLHDESQEVARAYGAKTTPDVFVVDADGVLRYRGAPDADHGDESLDAGWLRAALNGLRAGEDIELSETDPVGCSIKWKP